MGRFKIYVYAFLHKLIVFFIACLLFSVFEELCLGIYRHLSGINPSLFLPVPHPITDKEEYLLLMRRLGVFAAVPTIFSVTYFSEPFANERYEYIVKKTDGMYFIRDGARLYFPRYALADLAATLIIPSALIAIISFVPIARESETLLAVFKMCENATQELGAIWAALLLFAFFFLSSLAGGFRALKAFRGKWLSAIGKVG